VAEGAAMNAELGRLALSNAFAGWLIQVVLYRRQAGAPITVKEALAYNPHANAASNSRMREAASCYAITVYLMTQIFGFRQAHVAAAIGLSRVRICQMVAEVERLAGCDALTAGAIAATVKLFEREAA